MKIFDDELAFLKFNKDVLDSAAFAYSQASESAEKNGAPHFRLVTTTPNKLNLPEAKYCFSLIQEAVRFDESWYDMSIEVVKDIINHNSNNDFCYIEFSYAELGRDEAWVRKQKRLVNNDLQTIKREIFLEWAMSDEDSVFDEETMEKINEYVITPQSSFYLKEVYRFDILSKVIGALERNFCISVDVAGALEKDSTVITVIDPLTYIPVMQMKSNKIDTDDTCELLNILVDIYFPNGVICPERNNVGIALIQKLLKTPAKANLYYEVKERVVEKNIDRNYTIGKIGSHQKNQKTKKETRVYGIDTTPKSRDFMYKDVLNMVVNDKPYCINNNNIFSEIKTLTINKKGKVEAGDGFHDDALMSYLVGMYAMLYGNRRNKFFKVIHASSAFEAEDSENRNTSRTQVNNLRKFQNIMNGKSSYQFLNESTIDELDKAQRMEKSDKVPSLNKEHTKKQVSTYNRLRSLF